MSTAQINTENMKEVINAINYGAPKEIVFYLLNKYNIKFVYKRFCDIYPNNQITFSDKKFTNI